MKYVVLILCTSILFGCGTNFFLNKEPYHQYVTIKRGERSLTLEGQSLIEDNVIRMQLKSDFYRGDAEIVFEKGNYHMKYFSLPMDESQKEYIKEDLYAAFYAGDYPFHSDYKMFGEAVMEGGIKSVKAEDGYELYKISYNDREIIVDNIVREYRIIIVSDKAIHNTKQN